MRKLNFYFNMKNVHLAFINCVLLVFQAKHSVETMTGVAQVWRVCSLSLEYCLAYLQQWLRNYDTVVQTAESNCCPVGSTRSSHLVLDILKAYDPSELPTTICQPMSLKLRLMNVLSGDTNLV